MKIQYMDELEAPYTPLLVIKEASRCLLCHDAPCSKACPAETDPGKFIRSVLFRNFKGAAETIRENNALGGTCARVCPVEKLCQDGCSRSGIDTPIDIGRIQRFVTDFEAQAGMRILKAGTKDRGKIAVVGSGPAGLQASVTLTDLGYDVTVYEKEAEFGGWLRWGIPEYRLPNRIVDHEIAQIKEIGVNFISGVEVGRDITLESLKKENLAVLLTVGASYGISLSAFDNNKWVDIAADFLPKIKSRKGAIELPKSVLVIGGGDVAMDTATSLKILGVESVTCVAREELAQFPASKQELNHALSVKVSIIDGFTPTSVTENTVTFEHVRLKSTLTVTADRIVLAVGQRADLQPFTGIDHQRGIVETNRHQTSDAKVFAAGDIVKGDKTVVYAVKSGKEAAKAIHRYLEGEPSC